MKHLLNIRNFQVHIFLPSLLGEDGSGRCDRSPNIMMLVAVPVLLVDFLGVIYNLDLLQTGPPREGGRIQDG